MPNDDSMPLSVNAPRLADKMKKFKDSMNIHTYKERGEEHTDNEVTEVEHHGKIVGRFVKHGDQIVESSGSHDAQTSGIHEEVAKKVGQKKEDIIHTSAANMAKDSHDDYEDDDRTARKEPEKAKMGGESKEVKAPAKPKEGKVDNSMSKMASIESVETQGAPDLTKSHIPLAGKMANMTSALRSLNKAYKVTAKPGEISYSKVTPEEQEGKPNVNPEAKPNWKTKWESKSAKERMDFQRKLSQNRIQKEAPKKMAMSEHIEPSTEKFSDKMFKMCNAVRKP